MVDIAASGAAAIRAVSATPYDVVFMDIFMPGMGGQEATQRIRALDGPAQVVPIVALTASGSDTDDAAYRAFGMNGLLAKPVSPPQLREALEQYVWYKTTRTIAPAAGDQEVDVSDGHTLLSADRVKELRDNLPTETLNSLIEECLTDLDHRFPALRRALTAGARPAIAAQAHAMVGMAAGYGMAALETRLRGIMDAARDGTVDPAVAADVEADLKQTAAALRGLMQKELA
jgi:CheY-like chemotaxis protein